MQCMEIWGGNQRISTNVSAAGIDAWVYSVPWAGAAASSGEVDGSGAGGDIHYLTSCATGRITRMIVADVSGHGKEVATIAANLRRLMGRFANYIDQTQFVGAVNKRFADLRDQSEAFSGLFATAIVATYFAPTDQLTLSNAGHPRPLWFDSRSKRWSVIGMSEPEPPAAAAPPGGAPDGSPSNLPLGVLDETRYQQRTIRLAFDDLVLIYSDPFIEIRDPRTGRQFGERGLLDMVSSVDPEPAPTFIDRFLAAVAAAANLSGTPDGGIGLDDDATLLLLKPNAAKPKPSLGLATIAAMRIAGRAVHSVFTRDLAASFPQINVRSILGAMLPRANRP